MMSDGDVCVGYIYCLRLNVLTGECAMLPAYLMHNRKTDKLDEPLNLVYTTFSRRISCLCSETENVTRVFLEIH